MWFISRNCSKPTIRAYEANNGFDDERGDLKIFMNDHIMYRFEIVGKLGKGSFGQVLKCFDHKRKEYMAIKIIRNKKRFHRQAVVEVRVLETLRKNDPDDNKNVIKMREYFLFRKHLVIVVISSALLLNY